MMHCWLLTRTEVVMKVNRDDVLMTVVGNEALFMANEMMYCWWLTEMMHCWRITRTGVLLTVNNNWGIDDWWQRWCIIDYYPELMFWWRLTDMMYCWWLNEMMYCWRLARTEVLITVNGDDAQLMVTQNWSIDDG